MVVEIGHFFYLQALVLVDRGVEERVELLFQTLLYRRKYVPLLHVQTLVFRLDFVQLQVRFRDDLLHVDVERKVQEVYLVHGLTLVVRVALCT